MYCLFQRHWHTGVKRVDEQTLIAESTYNGTDMEAVATMQVDVYTFKVKRATWEEYRTSSATHDKAVDVPELIGVEAYFGCGPAIHRAAEKLPGRLPQLLFAEAVRGIIQAETYVYRERGHSDPEAYDRYWDNFYANSCRYYSNLERTTVPWRQYVGKQERPSRLYTRFKGQGLYRTDGGEYILLGHLTDSFHEVAVRLILNRELTEIQQASVEMLRVPDAVCREAAGLMENLRGEKIQALTKKSVAHLLGGKQGCVHVIDTVYDLIKTVFLYKRE